MTHLLFSTKTWSARWMQTTMYHSTKPVHVRIVVQKMTLDIFLSQTTLVFISLHESSTFHTCHWHHIILAADSVIKRNNSTNIPNIFSIYHQCYIILAIDSICKQNTETLSLNYINLACEGYISRALFLPQHIFWLIYFRTEWGRKLRPP
jgi:hypothetical protein